MSAQVRVPTYALYGEYLEQSLRDVLHFEPLRDRSAKHDWSIALHKHNTLWQVFHVRSAGAVMRLGDDTVETSGPVIVSVPPMFVHGFQFPRNVLGGVVSVRFPVVLRLLDDTPGSDLLAERVWLVTQSDAEFASLARCFDNVRSGFSHIDSLRNRHLEVNLDALLVSFTRHALSSLEPDPLASASQDDELLRRFCALIEEHYRANWPVSRYAEVLGVSTIKLNRRCREVLATTPQHLLARRRGLEARRLLQFTQGSVADVAEQLGFADTSYFCRWFAKGSGQTPAAYRRSAAT